MAVKRYDFDPDGEEYEDEVGDFVKYSDHLTEMRRIAEEAAYTMLRDHSVMTDRDCREAARRWAEENVK